MFRRNENIGKGFVVPQQHIVFWFELLDQVLFEQQRFCFGARGQKHHRRRFRDHSGDAPRMAGRTGVTRDPQF